MTFFNNNNNNKNNQSTTYAHLNFVRERERKKARD